MWKCILPITAAAILLTSCADPIVGSWQIHIGPCLIATYTFQSSTEPKLKSLIGSIGRRSDPLAETNDDLKRANRDYVVIAQKYGSKQLRDSDEFRKVLPARFGYQSPPGLLALSSLVEVH